MEELNKNIQVIAIESEAKSRVLLALKDVDIESEDSECLSILLNEGLAYPEAKLDLIARETTFNSYNFVDDEDKESYLALFKRYLNDDNIKKINDLFFPPKEETQ